MLRVCRPGGRIGLASWTPAGFIGQMFKVVGAHVPPPAGVRSPALWGTEAHLQELFPNVASMTHTRQNFAFRYRSPEHFVDVFRSWYGPVLKAFAALDDSKKQALEADILSLIARFNQSGDGTAVIPAEYVEVTIDRR